MCQYRTITYFDKNLYWRKRERQNRTTAWAKYLYVRALLDKGREREVEWTVDCSYNLQPNLIIDHLHRLPTTTTILNFYYLNDLCTTTTCLQRPVFWGPKGGRYTQVWLYFQSDRVWEKGSVQILRVKSLHCDVWGHFGPGSLKTNWFWNCKKVS